MTKTQLLEKITDNGWNILQDKQGPVEEKLENWDIAIYQKVGSVIIRRWLHYYIEDGMAYWQDRDPFQVLTPTSEEKKEFELNKLRVKAKEMAELVNIGLESQGEFDKIKTEYLNLK